ncbi:MAG: BamA/TamA family outer membrane protein [Leptospiraceae bacterium]|nr:BamA/TamA family outer membrane protein [Leptospiraceae bacterium]
MKVRHFNKYLVFLSLVWLVLFLGTKPNDRLFSQKNQYIGKTITDIKFKGNKNTPEDEILSFIEMRKGQVLTEKLLNNDLKALFSTGFFYFIDMEAEKTTKGVRIVYILKERPKIETIEFVGADEVFPSDIRDKLPLKENGVITPAKVNASKELILKKYRDEGYFHAYVKVDVGKINPKKNTVNVTFVIDEGDEIPVAKINIIGAQTVSASEIMGILELKEEGLIESGHFKEADFETDKQKIVAFLKSKGYIDAELVSEGTGWEIRWEDPKKKDKRVIIVNFKIKEGDIYFYNGYTTEHDLSLDGGGSPIYLNKEENPPGTKASDLKPIYETKKLEEIYEFTEYDVGEIFDEGKFFRDRALINEMYSSKGYLFAQVIPNKTQIVLSDEELSQYENCNPKVILPNTTCEETQKRLNIKKLRKTLKDNPSFKGKKFVHVDFLIRENGLAYIENIIIKGNKKTQDKVIRRELLFKPGDLFNSQFVNRSRERIFNLGYFKEVNFNMRPGSDETKVNLIIEVVEQPTGTISMGGGYGTISGFSIFTELGEKNLNGTGQNVSGRIQFGPYQKYLSLNWTEPWLYDQPWSLSLGLFYSALTIPTQPASITDNNYNSIKERATYERTGIGFSVGLGHRFLVNWSHFHIYQPSFFRSSKPTPLAPDFVLAEVNREWQFRSKITNGISYDNRDNVFSPTRGTHGRLSFSNMGQYLGGTSHYDQISPLIEYYHSWFDYTLGGLFRSNKLRRWQVVQEFRSSSVFTFERVPKYGRPNNPVVREQDRIRNPYIQYQDLNYIGGYETLRGWNYNDTLFPSAWNNRTNHRVLFSSELRFPIEPSLLWLVMFFDSGAMFDEVNRWVGAKKSDYKAYDNLYKYPRAGTDPAQLYFLEHYSLSALPNLQKLSESPFRTNDPGRLILSKQNFALDTFKYSWGIGLRIQIPVLPLRLFFAQKLRYTGDPNHPFAPYEQDKNFHFVFGIGDFRF